MVNLMIFHPTSSFFSVNREECTVKLLLINHYEQSHMGSEYVSREKKLSMVNFLIFVQTNVSTIRFQEIKIRPFGDFEKMRFLCF